MPKNELVFPPFLLFFVLYMLFSSSKLFAVFLCSPHPFPIPLLPLHRFARNTGVFTKHKVPIQRLRSAIAIGKPFWFLRRAQSQNYFIGLGERVLDNATYIYQIFVLANNKCP